MFTLVTLAKTLFSFLTLCLIVQLATAATCGAGYYDSTNIERPCYPCSAGYYCPGDGYAHACSAGTIAPGERASSCQTCESKRSNSDRTICLLPDVPSDAREITDSVVNLNVKQPYYYLTLYKDGYAGYPPKVVQLSLVGKRGDVQVLVYASYKTGKPSQSSAEYANEGFNATVSVPFEDRQLVYLNIVPIGVETAQVDLKQFKYLDAVFTLIPNTVNHIKTSSELGMHINNLALFVVENVPVGSKVNLTIKANTWNDWDNSPFTYTLFWSNQPNIEYPNPNNANVIVKSSFEVESKATLIAKMPATSQKFVVGLFRDTTYYYANIYATVTFIK